MKCAYYLILMDIAGLYVVFCRIRIVVEIVVEQIKLDRSDPFLKQNIELESQDRLSSRPLHDTITMELVLDN